MYRLTRILQKCSQKPYRNNSRWYPYPIKPLALPCSHTFRNEQSVVHLNQHVMKTLKNTGRSILAAIALLVIAAANPVKAQPGMSVSFQLFYDQLAPHGEWIDDPEYGYIWIPNAGPDFQPYATNGHWVMTTYGNTWVSNYDWGWAPFHYGRWTYSDYYGWAWVPGYEWGPAWVSWRSGGGYYGWAPLGPRMSININIGIPRHHWIFVPQRYITSARIYSYYVPYRSRVNIYNRTTIINNTYVYNNRTYVSGPQRGEIERVTRSRVAVREINNATRPGRASVNNRSVNIYRPEVDRNTRSSARPSRVADATSVRSANSRTASSSRTGSQTQTTPSRGTTATRGSQTTTRSNSEAVRSARSSGTRTEATRPTGQTSTTRAASGTSRTREAGTVRSNTSRQQVTSRSEANTPQRATAPSTRQTAKPAAPRQSSRPATSVRSSAPSRSSSTPAARTQNTSSSRATSVSSRTSSRPSVSTGRSSEKSSSTRSGSANRGSSSSRNRG